MTEIPADQLPMEVDATAHATRRAVLDILLDRVEVETHDQLSELAGAGDRTGAPPTEAATALIDRHNAVRTVLIAQAWGECQQ